MSNTTFFILPDADAGDAKDELYVAINGAVQIISAEGIADLLVACNTARLQMIAFGNLMNWSFETPQSYADAINGLADALEKAGIEVKR